MPRAERPELRVHLEDSRGRCVLVLVGELDIGGAPTLREALLGLLARDDVPDVWLDLAGVSFLDSSGLAVLLMGARRWRAEGRRLVLTRPARVARRVIDLTGAAPAFEFEEADGA